MWTLLGIASFTYMYKKCDAVLSFAHKEIVLAAVSFICVGLILTYAKYRYGQSIKVPHMLRLPLEILSALPLTNRFISKPSIINYRTSTGSSKKVSNGHFLFSFIKFHSDFYCKNKRENVCM